MPLSPDDVAQRIREARVAHGWTHDELARRMGVSWRTVQRWQKGKLPRLGTLLRLADVLGVPRSYLIEDEDPAASLKDLHRRLEELTRRVQELSEALERAPAPPARRRTTRQSRRRPTA
jgi:transcriptional regulator with XRE-family HTH domain